MTLRLDPAELGHVQVRVDRNAEGVATVQVTAERPDTLRLLATEQPQLHRALDTAGLPSEGRTITFSLGTAPAQNAPTPPTGAQGGDPGNGTGGQRFGGRPARGNAFTAQDDETGHQASERWLRAGVDITA